MEKVRNKKWRKTFRGLSPNNSPPNAALTNFKLTSTFLAFIDAKVWLVMNEITIRAMRFV